MQRLRPLARAARAVPRRAHQPTVAPLRRRSTLSDEYAGAMDSAAAATHVVGTHRLESGDVLRHAGFKYRTWGQLNAARDNCLVVCHALTGSHELGAWWGGLLGPGRAFDTDKYFVVCVNTIGSPYGSHSPLTGDGTRAPTPGLHRDRCPERALGARCPPATVRDAVALQAAVLRDALGVDSVAAVVGGSMGGMLALEFCYQAAPEVRAAVLCSTNGRHGAWQIAMNALQRNAIRADPLFAGGDYGAAPPLAGLSLARQVGMVSYRTHNAYATKFGRRTCRTSPGDDFEVESYLAYQGAKIADRGFDANCYLYLTRLMDSHDVARGRGEYPAVLGDVAQPTLVLGVDSDVLYPLHEQAELADNLGNCRGFHTIHSDEGHDGFLLEQDTVGGHIAAFLADQPGAPA